MSSLKIVMILLVLVAVIYTHRAAADPTATSQDFGIAAEMSAPSSPVETTVVHDLDVAQHIKKKYKKGRRGGGGGSSEERR